MDPLGGLFDQFLGPDGLDGLGDLFGLGPDGSQAPDDPSGGSEMADQLLRQLLDEFLRELAPRPRLRSRHRMPHRLRTRHPRRTVRMTRAPMRSTSLMQQLLDELLQGLSPDGTLDPFAPDAGTDGGEGA